MTCSSVLATGTESGYILKVELRGFADDSDMRERRAKEAPRSLAWATPFNDGEGCVNNRSGGNVWSLVLDMERLRCVVGILVDIQCEKCKMAVGCS